jgi:hypothetical protein
MRLYRENLALKVQLDALAAETTRRHGKRARVSRPPERWEAFLGSTTKALGGGVLRAPPDKQTRATATAP